MKDLSTRKKILFSVVFFLILGGSILAALVSLLGIGKLNDGVTNLDCALFTTLNDLLNGTEKTADHGTFFGLKGAIEETKKMQDALEQSQQAFGMLPSYTLDDLLITFHNVKNINDILMANQNTMGNGNSDFGYVLNQVSAFKSLLEFSVMTIFTAQTNLIDILAAVGSCDKAGVTDTSYVCTNADGTSIGTPSDVNAFLECLNSFVMKEYNLISSSDVNNFQLNLNNNNSSLLAQSPACSAPFTALVAQAVSLKQEILDLKPQTVLIGLGQVFTNINTLLNDPKVTGAFGTLKESSQDGQKNISEYLAGSISSKSFSIKPYMNYAFVAEIILVCLVLLPILLAIIAFVRGFNNQIAKPKNPCPASFAIHCTFWYTFIILILALLCGVLGYLLSSVCRVIENPTHAYLDKLVLSQGSQESLNNIVNILVICGNSSGTGDFLGNIFDSSKTSVKQIFNQFIDTNSGLGALNEGILTALSAGQVPVPDHDLNKFVKSVAALAGSADALTGVTFQCILNGQMVQNLSFKDFTSCLSSYVMDSKARILYDMGLLQGMVDGFLNLLASADCSFFKKDWAYLIDSLCFHIGTGVIQISLAWVATAVLMLVLIFLEFLLWRRMKDARCLMRDAQRNL